LFIPIACSPDSRRVVVAPPPHGRPKQSPDRPDAPRGRRVAGAHLSHRWREPVTNRREPVHNLSCRRENHAKLSTSSTATALDSL
jgi:hypothetical protein